MKTVLAQCRKDLIANSVLLWVWVICVGIDCLCFLTRLPFHSATANEPEVAILFGSLIGGLTIVVAAFLTQSLLAIVLLVRIVQSDSLTDSSAFWRTRPIARHQLLAGKTLFAALFLAGGFLAGWAIDPGSPHLPHATTVLGTLVFVSGLFAFAAVTADFSKFIVAFLPLALGAMIVAAILLALLRHLATAAGMSATSWPLAAQPLFAGEHGHVGVSVFYLLAFVSIIVWQYLTLRTNVSRALLFSTFLLAALLQGGSGGQVHSRPVPQLRGP